VIGISLDDLQAIPWSVVVAGGTEKHAAIRAALEGNYFSVMVTDAETADYLLSML
jgi:DNA-binding transcriptional regulator LsrR (DeoR family)